MSAEAEVLTFLLQEKGAFPNNPHLPLLVYPQAVELTDAADPAERFETVWRRNDWQPAWRWGVYDFPHYHSTAHEALGVYRGSAKLRFGNSPDATVQIHAGDMIVIPAGVAHQNLGASDDFHVVGGYPHGQSADLMRGKAGERPGADHRIHAVPLPTSDPLFGSEGPLIRYWRQ